MSALILRSDERSVDMRLPVIVLKYMRNSFEIGCSICRKRITLVHSCNGLFQLPEKTYSTLNAAGQKCLLFLVLFFFKEHGMLTRVS